MTMVFSARQSGDRRRADRGVAMSGADGFYTMKGYALQESGALTTAMEDYLEMIARLKPASGRIRVRELSETLHVKASSVTKMVRQLAQAGLLRAERYGAISLTERGQILGNYLLYRHDVLQRFLCALNESDCELEQAEKIEHFLDERTVRNLERLTQRLLEL